ncbi:MAG: hypothetical protein QM705_00910 [Ancrocorticia sp.]
MDVTPISIVASLIALIPAFAPLWIEFPHPKKWSATIHGIFSAIGIFASTGLHISLLPANTTYVILYSVVLTTLAVASPVAGVVQRKINGSNSMIYSVDQRNRNVDVRNRFISHLLTNSLGCSAVVLLMVMHQSLDLGTTQVDTADVAIGAILPVSSLVVFLFARVQQEKRCPEITSLEQSKDGQQELKFILRGDLMSEYHQTLNTVYLVSALFLGAGNIVSAFAGALLAAKLGSPVDLSPWFMLAIVSLLSFLLACGVNTMPIVFATFQTGVPAALSFATLWMMLFRPSTSRDISIIVLVVVFYSLYCILLHKRVKETDSSFTSWHFFAPTLLAGGLASFLIAVYMTP